jgi:hypothetical protein
MKADSELIRKMEGLNWEKEIQKKLADQPL